MQLTVKNFSCIKEAKLRLAKLTVLTGPQASGKSVLSKLIYFSINKFIGYTFLPSETITLAEFKADIADEFKKMFPPVAWGDGNFSVVFEAGKLEIKISRRKKKTAPGRGRANDSVVIGFSKEFEDFFAERNDRIDRALAAVQKKTGHAAPQRELEVMWRVENILEGRLKDLLGEDYLQFQLFIPAGRSFFTSLGRAVVAFEQGGMLDPVTVQFGRIFTSIRDRPAQYFPSKEPPTRRDFRDLTMQKLFGGEVRFSRSREFEFVESEDGRKVPFSSLSSGQQELLPLWAALTRVANRQDDLVYLEEPEAHLFPSAQSTLIEYLASLVMASGKRMIITTHSPYVLAKLNNLMKAGDLSKRLGRTSVVKLNNIVDKSVQLPKGSVLAYAIQEGKLISIIDDGLVDGQYLDDVSGEISREFMSLLELESKSQ